MFLNIDKHDREQNAALDTNGQRITYGELADFCKKFRTYIPGRSLIFILSENTVGSLAGYVAALENQVVPLLVNAHLEKELLTRLIEKYQPEYLWSPSHLSLDWLKTSEMFSLYDFNLNKIADVSTPLLNDNLSLLLSTSGSTGSPKLVRHSYYNVAINAQNVSNFFQLNSKDRAIAVLPMHYTMGLSVVSSHLFAGSTLLLTDLNLLDKEFWNFIKEKKATSFTGVPFSFELLKKLRFFRMDLPDLELITQGGGKLDKNLFIELAEYAKENGKRFIATYGQTEGTARMSYLPSSFAHIKTGSIGIPIPMGKLYLVGSNEDIIEENNIVGELVYEGPNVTMGYAEKKEDLLKGDERKGILFTGDMAYKDEDGFFYIVGRRKRFLKIHGSRVSLDELEYLIKSNFDTDCYCTGDDDFLKVFITNSEVLEKVQKNIKEKVGLFHKSFKVEHILKIPRNEYGKIVFD